MALLSRTATPARELSQRLSPATASRSAHPHRGNGASMRSFAYSAAKLSSAKRGSHMRHVALQADAMTAEASTGGEDYCTLLGLSQDALDQMSASQALEEIKTAFGKVADPDDAVLDAFDVLVTIYGDIFERYGAAGVKFAVEDPNTMEFENVYDMFSQFAEFPERVLPPTEKSDESLDDRWANLRAVFGQSEEVDQLCENMRLENPEAVRGEFQPLNWDNLKLALGRDDDDALDKYIDEQFELNSESGSAGTRDISHFVVLWDQMWTTEEDLGLPSE